MQNISARLDNMLISFVLLRSWCACEALATYPSITSKSQRKRVCALGHKIQC